MRGARVERARAALGHAQERAHPIHRGATQRARVQTGLQRLEVSGLEARVEQIVDAGRDRGVGVEEIIEPLGEGRLGPREAPDPQRGHPVAGQPRPRLRDQGAREHAERLHDDAEQRAPQAPHQQRGHVQAQAARRHHDAHRLREPLRLAQPGLTQPPDLPAQEIVQGTGSRCDPQRAHHLFTPARASSRSLAHRRDRRGHPRSPSRHYRDNCLKYQQIQKKCREISSFRRNLPKKGFGIHFQKAYPLSITGRRLLPPLARWAEARSPAPGGARDRLSLQGGFRPGHSSGGPRRRSILPRGPPRLRSRPLLRGLPAADSPAHRARVERAARPGAALQPPRHVRLARHGLAQLPPAFSTFIFKRVAIPPGTDKLCRIQGPGRNHTCGATPR
jgi:hypothetical protein